MEKERQTSAGTDLRNVTCRGRGGRLEGWGSLQVPMESKQKRSHLYNRACPSSRPRCLSNAVLLPRAGLTPDSPTARFPAEAKLRSGLDQICFVVRPHSFLPILVVGKEVAGFDSCRDPVPEPLSPVDQDGEEREGQVHK